VAGELADVQLREALFFWPERPHAGASDHLPRPETGVGPV